MANLLLLGVVVLCAASGLAWQCIDEGQFPNVPIPEHNITYPGAKMCEDLTPDRNYCLPLLWNSSACQGGYYLHTNKNSKLTVLPCPAGFYCPMNTRCLTPCPLGAHCVDSVRTFKPGRNPPLKCDPDYKTQQTTDRRNVQALRCGGPAALDDTVICKKGNYCPNVSTQLVCPKGHYCRAGRISPQPCPFLSQCKAGTSAPIVNGIGLIFDLLLIGFVVVLVICLKYQEELKKYFKNLRQRHRSSQSYEPRDNEIGDECDDDETRRIAGAREMSDLDTTSVKRSGSQSSSGSTTRRKAYTMEVVFRDLSLTLNNTKKKVLRGATGRLRPKTLTAIMGGSGAGKTTLLNALSGKAYYGHVEGHVEINGKPGSIETYRSIMGFVPQEDTMHRELTAQEVLFYQGVLRLSGCATIAEIRRKVDDVLALLGLSHIANSEIGDEEKRGISGGQRKRVNIGMELVCDPTLLFLDEPTSGLDSVSSMQVCEALQRVAEESHLTVVAVLHQPRFEIFQMFHEVILLQPGGTIAFQGSTQQAEAYFMELGYPVKTNINPSDHYLDVINEHNLAVERQQSLPHAAGANEPDGSRLRYSLGDMWTQRLANMFTDGQSSTMQSQASSQEFKPRKPAPFFIQLWFFIQRCFVLLYRRLGVLVLDQMLVLIAGAVLGALYTEILLRKLALLLCMTSMAVALTSMLASLRCFGSNKPVFWRESSTGINRLAYFLAVNISQLPIIVFTPLVFLSLFYTLVSPRTLFKDYYLAVLMLVWASYGLGFTISTIFSHRSSQMATVVLVLVSAMLSGAQPSLCKMNKLVIGPVLYSLSFARWFVEALFEKEANRYPDVLINEVALYASHQGYSLNNFDLCIVILFVFGLVSRVIALLCLMFTNRGQQK